MIKKLLFVIFVSSFMLLGVFIFQFQKSQDGKLHIVFCDVGQGDGIFIKAPDGVDIVIDAGPDDKIVSCLSRHMPFWDKTIELAFATHPDADHITGFESILKNYNIIVFNTSKKTSDTAVFKRIQNLISQKQIPVRFIYAGDSYEIGESFKIDTLWPSKEYIETESATDTNSYSLVQILSFGNFKVLLTGDIESDILNTLFSSKTQFDVFKLPHHGSKTGVDDETFGKIGAKLGIISAGTNNRYGHPSREVIELLKKYNMPYKRTDREGDIEIVIDPSN